MTKTIGTVPLPTHDVKLNDELIITGIGKTGNGAGMSSCLKYYEPKVVDCKKHVSPDELKVLDNNICHKSDLGYKGLSVSTTLCKNKLLT